MGIALILLGLVAAGLVVDFAVENWSSAANDLSFSLFGGSFTATQVEVAIGAAGLGGGGVARGRLGGARRGRDRAMRARCRTPARQPGPAADHQAADLGARTRERGTPGEPDREGGPRRPRRRARARRVLGLARPLR